jgi:hypothetical protein
VPPFFPPHRTYIPSTCRITTKRSRSSHHSLRGNCHYEVQDDFVSRAIFPAVVKIVHLRVHEARNHSFLCNEVMFHLPMSRKSQESLLRSHSRLGVSVGTLKPRVSGILSPVMRTRSEPKMAHKQRTISTNDITCETRRESCGSCYYYLRPMISTRVCEMPM